MAEAFVRQNSADQDKKLLAEYDGFGYTPKVVLADRVINVDVITSELKYVGKAAPGSATNAAVWQVQKLTLTAAGGLTMQWADGDAAFDNVWDDRLILVYP